jgi:adhesin/invasin
MFRKAMCFPGLMPVLIIVFLGLLSGCGTGGLADAPAGTSPTTGTSPTIDLSVSVAASPTSVSGGQTSIITATVTGDDSSGAAVIFSLPVNSSGASFINASGSRVSSITVAASGSGIASAIYQAGSLSSGAEVQDIVQAFLTNGANGAVILNRTVTTATTYAVSIDASAISVTAGQVSIITATVASGSTPAGGVTVTFTLPVNSSGATLSAATATTDGSGKAVVTYLPGTTNPMLTVDDTVQAAVGTATSAVAITRTGSSTTYAVSIIPSTTSVTAGQVSIITATVTSGSTAAGGVTATFALPVNNSGATLTTPSGTGTTVTATTDSTGNAVAIYQPGTTDFDRTVSDSVQASVTGASTAVSITRTGSYVSDIRIDVSNSVSPSWNGQSVMTATVINNDGTPISGVTVTFSVAAGGTAGGSVSPSTATTDNNGDAVSVYKANNTAITSATDVVIVSVTRGDYTYTDGVVIPVGAHP